MDDFKEIAKFQFESAQARLERVIKRMWVLCLLLIILLVLSNGLWMYHESKFSTEEHTTIRQEIDGNDAFVMDGIHLDSLH